MLPAPGSRLLAYLASAATLAGLGCAGAAPQTEPVNPEPTPVVTEPTDGPFLWRVEGETGPSYLFGTVHLGVRADELPQNVYDAVDASERFVLEADLSQVDRMEVIQMATLPPTDSLEKQLGADAFDQLVRMLSPQIPRDQLNHLKPWAAYTSVLQNLYPTGTSMDEVLKSRARTANKKLIYLEGWRGQLELLSQVLGADDLKEILDPESKDRETLTKLIDAYKRGDFTTVSALIASPEVIAEDPEEFKLMFEDRNRAWVPTLARELRAGRVFVAVGAGHYAGDVGLLALLTEAGLQPVRVGAGATAATPIKKPTK